MTYALAFVFGYLLGSIPFGLLITRATGGPDLRNIGSGNIGATNVLRTGKKGLAAATLLCDAFKGTVAVLIVAHFAGHEAALIAGLGRLPRPSVSGLAQVQRRQRCRHLYRPVDRALLAGRADLHCDLARGRFSEPLFLACGASRQRDHAAGAVGLGQPNDALLFLALSVLTWVMHRANIARLLNGTEGKIGAKS